MPRQLGDILLTTPLARVLRQNFPNCHISWCSHPMGKQILEGNSDLNEILYNPVQPRRPVRSEKNNFAAHISFLWSCLCFIWAELKFVQILRQRKFDTVIDVMNNPHTAAYAFFTGAKTKISFTTRWSRNWVFNFKIDRNLFANHYLAAGRLQLLKPLGIDVSEALNAEWSASNLPISHADIMKINLWRSQNNLVSDKYFLMSATHRRELRKWPVASYVELALKLIQERGFPVIWLWGPGEKEEIEKLHLGLQSLLQAENLPEDLSVMPPLFSLRETGALSTDCSLWIGNSNGLSHIAVASGASTVQIHGPTRPADWTPIKLSQHRGVQRNEGCINCGKNKCSLPRRECLDDLSVSAVYENINELLSIPSP